MAPEIQRADTGLEFHPLADLFPLLEGADFEELVADVRAHGVREPVWIYDSQILDGRNRYLAAQVAGVPCPVRAYEGDDPVGFVISLNLKRRHLSTSQRAMIAAKLATLTDGQRADLVAGTSIEEAAQLLNVGRASVERARIVHEQDEPELIRAVETGEMSVAGAVEQIRRSIVTGVGMDPYAERGVDLYETPDVAVYPLLKVEQFTGTIWEPACGPGAIVRVLRAAGHRVVATDLVDYGCPDSSGGIDFLAQPSAPAGATTILTNPPFMHANAFVRHALTLTPRVVMLLRLLFLESEGRSDILDGGRLARVYLFRERIQTHRDGWQGPRSSNPMALAWFVWNRDHRGPIELRRISRHGDEAPPPVSAVNCEDDGLNIPGFLLRTAP
jgi:hypothetical protein